MTNQEILEKAITKAIEGGWNRRIRNFYVGALDADENGDHEQYDYESIIFNHDFAKAMWGEGYALGGHEVLRYPAWQYHLQQMVIADDPIQYLGENLPE